MRPIHAVLLAGAIVVTTVVSCLGSSVSPAGMMSIADMSSTTHDAATSIDSAAPDQAVTDAARPLLDLVATDIAGLFNCYGVAICDPNTDFCIKYYSGSAAVPGNLVNSPACFTPSDTCGNQGQNMDCGCIKNDPGLGLNCQGSCVDNQDGTFTCYAK